MNEYDFTVIRRQGLGDVSSRRQVAGRGHPLGHRRRADGRFPRGQSGIGTGDAGKNVRMLPENGTTEHTSGELLEFFRFAPNLDGTTAMMPLPPITPDPVIEAYKKDVDRSLLRENLKLTPEQRIRKLMELQRFAEELRRAGREAKGKAE